MICLRCEKEDFHEATHFVEQVYHGKTLSVETLTMECDHCGWVTVSLEQADALLRNTRETSRFEQWWEQNYLHMIQAASGNSVLAKNVAGLIKVTAKQAWLAAVKVSKAA